MNIEIMGHKKALEKVLEKPHFYNIVYITNPGDTFYDPTFRNVINKAKSAVVVKFYDFEFERDEHGVAGPNQEQVKAILEFAKDKDNLICACMAGISRSSGSAYSILCSRGIDPKEALKTLVPGHHYPNMLVVKHASELLSKPEMITIAKEWMANNLKVLEEVPDVEDN